jgi:hypothetical protein
MDFFFQLSERHAKEQIQFANDRQSAWDNLQAKYQENIPLSEKQRFSQEWVEREKAITAQQYKELSNIVELEKEQKAKEQIKTPDKVVDLEAQKANKLSDAEKQRLNEKLLPDTQKAEKAMEVKAAKTMADYLKEAEELLAKSRERNRGRDLDR